MSKGKNKSGVTKREVYIDMVDRVISSKRNTYEGMAGQCIHACLDNSDGYECNGDCFRHRQYYWSRYRAALIAKYDEAR